MLNHWIEANKTALELGVAALVILHIVLMWHEGRQLRRQFHTAYDHLAHVSTGVGTVVEKVNELERQQLLHALVSTAQRAEKSLIHYTYTFHLPEEEPEMGPLLEAVQNTSLEKGAIRFLGPDYQNNLNRLYARKKTGVSLKVSPDIKDSDLRFQVADGRWVVITIGSASDPSRQGFEIESVFLASILTSWFDEQWARSVEYDDFITNCVATASKIPQIAALSDASRLKYISSRLGLEESEVKRLWRQEAGP